MSRRVLFTFGNHMHWVDMQWLWGYDVLPGSVDDMLRLCREAGVKGNVNFEGLGYEKMAAEAPNALARLRDAVREGIVEPVGCSYGQPYGLFQGPESNVRQRTFGVRSTLRLLGVRPRSFWEEEFDFFPQLPQILDGCGFTCANLFFQWTWHTPEVPREETSLIRWEGIDGTSLPTLPRNSLNLHQWPEDFDGLFESDLLRGPDLPAIVQWIELMPSRDWMCRSEVLLPRLRELMARDDLRLEAGTMAEVVERLLAEKAGEPATGDGVPVRRYAPDEVWHGMTLGKNGDKHPRASRDAEAAITAAEKIASIAGLFGRPYPRWDVYPTWEIEEAWRELLAAQHHDNHECEGLCGDIGATGFRKAECLAHGVTGRTLDTLVPRIARPGGQMVVFNGQGWSRDIVVQDPADEGFVVVRDVPPFGYRAVDPDSPRWTPADPISIEASRDAITLRRREMEVEVDRGTGRVRRVLHPYFPEGLMSPGARLPDFRMKRGGRDVRWRVTECVPLEEPPYEGVHVRYVGPDGIGVWMGIHLDPLHDALLLRVRSAPDAWDRPDPGLGAALTAGFRPGFGREFSLLTDSPYAIHPIEPTGSFRRKYPTGDWMTSTQWFETVDRPFTAQSFADLLDGTPEDARRGVIIAHDGSQQFFRTDDGVRVVLTAYDPWDEDRFDTTFHASLWIMPHNCPPLAQRRRRVVETTYGHQIAYAEGSGRGELPSVFGALAVRGAPNVHATALHRESARAGEDLPDWAGHELARRSGGACTHPYLVRLVEQEGSPAEVELVLPGEVGAAAKVNLLGELLDGAGWLEPAPAEPPPWARDITLDGRPLRWSSVRVPVRPREIATVMIDLLLGRKQYRDLDAKRDVWATVHRSSGF